MLEKLKGLSTRAKIAVASGAALLVAAGIGLAVWQPWNQAEEPPAEPAPPQQVDQQPQPPAEKGLSVKAGNEEIACTLYEGTGWSVYVPEDWTAEKLGENGALFSSPDGAQMSVRFEAGSDYSGSFINLSAGDGGENILQFYQGSGEGSPVVEGNAPEGQWTRYGRLFAALARTLTVGQEKPFEESFVMPQEPDWQEAEGYTVLFLDKDGFVVDEKVQDAVEGYMRTWPVESRPDYTGQYRVNDIQWAGSYTGVARDGYIDVFRADVQYRLKEGAAPEGVQAVNGWASMGEDVYLAIIHDGGSVDETKWTACAPGVGPAELLAGLTE